MFSLPSGNRGNIPDGGKCWIQRDPQRKSQCERQRGTHHIFCEHRALSSLILTPAANAYIKKKETENCLLDVNICDGLPLSAGQDTKYSSEWLNEDTILLPRNKSILSWTWFT